MNFLILFVIFLTLCEEMVNLQTLTKKTPLSIYEYSFDLQSSATKTIFFLYALMRQPPSELSVKSPNCFGCCRKDSELVWFVLVGFDLRQHTSEANVKVSSRSNLFWLF